MMQQTEQILCQRGAFSKLSGSATIKPASDTKPKFERMLGRRGDPLYRCAHPCSHILQLLLLPGNQHQSQCYSCGNVSRALPRDVTCTGYWEDITECHRLQISMRLSLSVRVTIIQHRTKHCAQSLPLIYMSCVLITAEAAELILIISFAINKLTALNHPFHIWHFHKGLLYENSTLRGEFTQKLTFLSSVFLRNIKGGVW